MPHGILVFLSFGIFHKSTASPSDSICHISKNNNLPFKRTRQKYVASSGNWFISAFRDYLGTTKSLQSTFKLVLSGNFHRNKCWDYFWQIVSVNRAWSWQKIILKCPTNSDRTSATVTSSDWQTRLSDRVGLICKSTVAVPRKGISSCIAVKRIRATHNSDTRVGLPVKMKLIWWLLVECHSLVLNQINSESASSIRGTEVYSACGKVITTKPICHLYQPGIMMKKCTPYHESYVHVDLSTTGVCWRLLIFENNKKAFQ